MQIIMQVSERKKKFPVDECARRNEKFTDSIAAVLLHDQQVWDCLKDVHIL